MTTMFPSQMPQTDVTDFIKKNTELLATIKDLEIQLIKAKAESDMHAAVAAAYKYSLTVLAQMQTDKSG